MRTRIRLLAFAFELMAVDFGKYLNSGRLLRVFIVFSLILSLSILFSCGGGDDLDLSSGWTMPDNSVTIGASGGEVSETDSSSPIYGAKVTVPAGALTQDRSFEIDEKFFRYPLPDGFIPYPSSNACFELIVSGEKPYGLNLTISFPVKGMTVADNEKACAIVYDSRAGKWIILTPDSIDTNTMTIATTYRDYWMWGKMNLDVIDREYVIGAAKERYGENVWNSAVDSIATAINELNKLRIDKTCSTWTESRNKLRNELIPHERDILEQYQIQLGNTCGACDLLSAEFGFELTNYTAAKIAILSHDIWELMTGGKAGYLPVVSDIDFLFDLEKFVALAFIESQKCQYDCVSKNLGLAVYAHYSIYYTYMIAHLFVTIVIEEGPPFVDWPWICPP